jgi:antiviral defense system Shedu protein SduA
MGGDDILSPERLVFWDEITHAEVTALKAALEGARDEGDMQRFLEAHPRILIQHLTGTRGAWVLPKQRLGSQYETDFLIAQKPSDGLIWYAVELERPQAKLFNKNGDPSRDLNHALRQITEWRIWFRRNRSYAVLPRNQSGLGLTDIDPELEGLVIMGRDADVDQRTTALRRELVRAHRIKLETYDWLLARAREHVEALERAGNRHPAARLFDAILNSPQKEDYARKAVEEVFGGTLRGLCETPEALPA